MNLESEVHISESVISSFGSMRYSLLRPLVFCLLQGLVATSCLAQIQVGLAGGVSFSNLSGDKPSRTAYETVPAPVVSAVFEVGLAEGIHLSAQPGYLKSGTNVSYDEPFSDAEPIDTASVRLHYLTLPVIVRVLSGSRWFVTAGPVLGYLTDATGRITDTSEKLDISDQFESYNVSVLFGFGKLFSVDRFSAFVEARLVWGFTNIGVTDSGQARVRTGGLQLLLGSFFDL